MPQLRALDLCCGAGGVSMGLHRAGYEVTGVDIAPQPHYPFPARFIQADALNLDPAWIAQFALVWASWPCQAFTTLRHEHADRSYPNLITPGRRLLEAVGRPWIMENVPGAPFMHGVMLCGTMFGLKVFRHRHFESSHLLPALAHRRHDGSTGTHRHPYSPTGGYVQVTGTGGNFTLAEGRAAMGIDWMAKAELAQAIPPTYSEYLGRAILPAVRAALREGTACA